MPDTATYLLDEKTPETCLIRPAPVHAKPPSSRDKRESCGSAEHPTPEERPRVSEPSLPDRVFARRYFLIVGSIAGAFVLWRLYAVVVLIFGAILLGLVLRALAQTLNRFTRMPQPIAVALIVLAFLGAIGAVVWLFGSQLQAQFALLAADLPQSVSILVRDMQATAWGQWLMQQVRDADLSAATGLIAGQLGAFFGSVFRVVAYVAVLAFAAVYLAIQPDRYRDGLLRLVPTDWRARFTEFLEVTATTLRRWIVAQSFTMLLVGILSVFGLWMIGVKAALALGLIAAVFAFVPYIGPVMASVPGILMAGTQGLQPALNAAIVYGAVHFIEGNLLTPLVQAEAVKLPPVLTIFTAVVFAILLGPVGVLLAAPITIVALVAINIFYLENALGETRAWPNKKM